MQTMIRTAILAGLLLCTAPLPGLAATDRAQDQPVEVAVAPCGAMPGMMMRNRGEMPCPKPCIKGEAPASAPCMTDDSKRPRRHHRMDRGHGLGQMDCDMMGRSHGRRQMDGGMPGMGRGMQPHKMGRMLFLDLATALELTEDQVFKLKAIHAECRRENIRQEAEARIARLELKDLLGESNWIPAAAEKLVRKIKTIEGDLQVRRLRAQAEARKVLTPEQLRKADAGGSGDEAESLFN